MSAERNMDVGFGAMMGGYGSELCVIKDAGLLYQTLRLQAWPQQTSKVIAWEVWG